jgi:DNA uptake protein ComE-like DNA-binding protein
MNLERTMRKTGMTALATAMFAVACSTDSAKTADTSAVVTADTAMTPAPAAAAPTPAPAATSSGKIDPNSVTAEQLSGIPGVTPEIASAVVAGRPYANNAALEKVLAKTKLTEAQRDSVYSRVWTPIDLNTASDAEILLIPGIGNKMLHEFKEYRPYTSIDQFRREIGKYVDQNEVARLESFVTIK